MPNGFIKLRSDLVTDWEWWDDHNTTRLYIYCVSMASWSDKKWKGKEIKRGEFVTGIPTLCAGTGLTEQQVRTALKHLISTGYITSTAHSKYRIITVNNYDCDDEDNSQTNRQATVNQQASNRQVTGKQQASNIILRKKDSKKEESKKEDNVYAHFKTFWSAYPRKVARQKAMQAFEELNVDDELLGIMLNAIKAQNRTWDDPQYIPYPENWLRNHRWEDEVEEPERTYDIEAFDNMTFLNELSVS